MIEEVIKVLQLNIFRMQPQLDLGLALCHPRKCILASSSASAISFYRENLNLITRASSSNVAHELSIKFPDYEKRSSAIERK